VNKKDNKKYAPYFPDLVDFQSKWSIYEILVVFAELWLANGTVQKRTRRESPVATTRSISGEEDGTSKNVVVASEE